jgi:ubiquinone/menaquinone biosynthesis C-methylase UbiE
MPTVQELYELWAGDSELRDELKQSLDPRGSDWLFEAFAGLGPRPGQLVADVGARDGRYAIRLVRELGLRAVAIDPVPLHCELARAEAAEAGIALDVLEGSAEELPLADGAVDWIWCRDVLSHVDVRRGLREFARVLRPGGAALAYVTLPTERLEPREAEELARSCALASFSRAELEAAAREAGLSERSADLIRSEWRERMIEDGRWDAAGDVLAIARLQRRRDELAAQYGEAAVEAARGGLVWGIYQVLGKLCPTVYTWEKRA